MKNGILVRDDLRQHIDDLDTVRVGLTDLEAAPALNDAPDLQCDLARYARIIREAANFLDDLRDRWNHAEIER